MATIGTEQFLRMKFERLAVPEKFKGILGNMSKVFMIIFYGKSGHGKTEMCIQLAKMLAGIDRVQWESYEQGHSADLQDAIARNDLKGLPIGWSDPYKDIREGVTLFEDLVARMSRPKSAKYWFIDSIDATKFTEADVLELRRLFGKKKGIVFISHVNGKVPFTHAGKKIEYYGHAGFFVNNYIAQAINKNRFGGFDPYVIYEKRARELNPLFFEKRDAEEKPLPAPAKGKRKASKEPDG